MTRTPADVTLEVAWSGDLTGVWTIGVSELGGEDTIGGTFGHNVFDDLTARGEDHAITITRGSGPDASQLNQGTCGITLNDPDGRYNPENPTSPIASDLDVMRPMRIRATHPDVNGGDPVGLFYGFIYDLEHDPDLNVRKSYFSGVDIYEWLGQAGAKPVIASTGPISEGDAIGLVLDAVGWTETALRDLDPGGELPDFSADGSLTSIELITKITQVGLGLFFQQGDGVVRYIDRYSRFAPQDPVATLDGSLITGLKPRKSVEGVVNRITVTREGGTPQTAVDEDSRRRYGYRDGQAITSDLLASDDQALSLAQLLVILKGSARAPVRPVALINRDDVSIVQQLEREIGDRVIVREQSGGTDFEGEILGIRHQLPGAGVHTTRFIVSAMAATVTYWTIGVSELGGSDIIGY